MTSRQIVGAAGLLAILAALALLLAPLTVGGAGADGCGTALTPRTTETFLMTPRAIERCEDKIDSRQLLGWGLGGAGLVALLGAVLTSPRVQRLAEPRD